tara:strand:- start:1458 stop:1898 length:441 start_codon:yes stop_codon:yes gene_type:complete
MINWQIIASLFYIGRLPYAPGSWCSLIILLFFSILPLNIFLQLGIIFSLITIGFISSNIVSDQLNEKDPSFIVIDEAAGMALALFLVPQSLVLYLYSFLIFRFLDIFKPSFIYHVQKLPKGWGIMVDDIVSGMITFIIIHLINIYI